MKEEYCPQCGSEELEIDPAGSFKGTEYMDYKCSNCGYQWSDEPDWDSMSGGHDDY